MAELVDLEVDRVDAVDQPANREPWLLLKAEEADELRANVQQLLRHLEEALRPLTKLELEPEVAEALNSVAKTAGLALSFKARKKPDEQYGYPYGYPPPGRARKEAELDVEALGKAVGEALAPHLQAALSEIAKAVAPAPLAPPSRQPSGEEPLAKAAPCKLGEGLFRNIVYGEDR